MQNLVCAWTQILQQRPKICFFRGCKNRVVIQIYLLIFKLHIINYQYKCYKEYYLKLIDGCVNY